MLVILLVSIIHSIRSNCKPESIIETKIKTNN